MPVNVETPPALTGEAEQQLRQLYSYLYRLSENLNVAMNNLTYEDIHDSPAVTSGGGKVMAAGSSAAETYNELRALITNTAEYVRLEEKKLTQKLESNYEAVSREWGSFQENINSTIETTANGVISSYGYDAKLNTLQEQAAGFSEYRLRTEGFIRQGFIDYDSDGIPIVGIAIGQNLRSNDVVIGGETYQQFDGTQSCAFYTADKVSFRINGQEVAYVSNRKLYINDVEITGSLTYGNWIISHDNDSFALKWIGASV